MVKILVHCRVGKEKIVKWFDGLDIEEGSLFERREEKRKRSVREREQ